MLVLTASSPLAHTAPGADDSGNHLRGAVYRLDPAPNYPQSLAAAGTELTDGHIGEGRIWTSGRSAGWSWRTPVTITLDLAAQALVDHVRIHTASGTAAGVYYPSQVLVFGGDGSDSLDFLGASGLGRDEDNSASPIAGSVDIRFPPHQVRQLVVVVFARGAFVFLSEAEAFGSSPAGKAPAGILSDAEALRRFAVEYRRAAIASLPHPQPTGPDITRRWAMSLGPDAARPTAALGLGCSAERIDPWAGERAVSVDEKSAAVEPEAPLVALTGTRDYAAWRIVNRSQTRAPAKIDIVAPAGVAVRILALAHAQALNYAWVPDVVTRFDGGILPSNSAMIVLVEAQPDVAGVHELGADIDCGGHVSSFVMKLSAIAPEPDVQPLHGNVWTYLHEPVTSALRCDADFLDRYGIDTADVHPDALLDAGKDRPTDLLRRYFRAYRNVPRVILYMDVKTRPWAFLTMTDDNAAAALRLWWEWVQNIAEEEGVRGELLLFPIDEPRSGDISRLMAVRRLVERAGISARIYATVDQDMIAGLLPVDVLQWLRPSKVSTGLVKLMKDREINSYDTKPDGKLLSPHGYYRSQGWRAFELDLAGIGVWALWDSTGLDEPNSGWNPFRHGDRERDFGLIYAAPDGCAWPSLRLLAWRRGIDENRLLRQCAKRLPVGRADQLVQDVTGRGNSQEATRALAEVVEPCR